MAGREIGACSNERKWVSQTGNVNSSSGSMDVEGKTWRLGTT